MNDRISTKAGIFESGEKDALAVQYKEGRLIACRNPKLTDYTVADGTEVICDRAFMNMKELKSITLPSSLKAIGESAFSGCKVLTDINIPEGVTEIRQATFRDCDTLSAIELPASVTEIDKFAFGRGLTTLVVNAPKMKIDRYAFMNARDFSTLIVPAGTADYYRSLLAEIRVKADVEEADEETQDNEPQSMLDMFASATAAEANEMTKGLFKSNNMEEEKRTKTVTIEVFGTELFLEPKDSDEEEVYDAYSRFKRNGMVFTVDGNEYGPIDLGIDYNVLTQEQIDEFQNFDVAEFFEESGAEEGMLYKNKAWTTIEIEIPEDEEFKANKACLVTTKFIYPDGSSDVTVCAFGYDGKVYDCAPGNSEGISGEKIWPLNSDDEEDFESEEGYESKEEEVKPIEDSDEMVFRYGFVDKSGNFIIKPQFESSGDFHEGLASAKINKKYGYIDKSGKVVIEPKFDKASDFSDGVARVNIDGQAGFIDKTGAYIIPPKFGTLDVGNFYDGLAPLCVAGKYGYIDKSGEFVIEPKFEKAYDFSNGVAKVKLSGKYGYIDKSGNFVIEPQFSGVGSFNDGLATIDGDDGYGYIDKSGEIVIEPQFEDAGDFSDGAAWVYVDDQYGYIDKTGEFIIDPQFEGCGDFVDGISYVNIDEAYHYIDKSGESAFDGEFDSANNFSEGVACVGIFGPLSQFKLTD